MGRLVKAILADKLSPEELDEVVSGFDVIGDIAVMKIPDILLAKKKMIANTLLEKVKTIKCVFRQTSPIAGDFRLMELEHLAGEDRTVTEHKESGCRFYVDVSKAFFSPRLSAERLRIADLVSERETVVNMFAGIGTFSIIIAKKKKTSINYAIDLNPDAYELILKNSFLNKVDDHVIAFLGDAGRIIEHRLMNTADRVLMPCPEKALEYFPYAAKALKEEGGVIHIYLHVKSKQMNEIIEEIMPLLVLPIDFKISSIKGRVVREVGPRLDQIVLDLEVTPRH
ncbi:MAG: class I SAM-dependent methyltransferase [Nitrososphaeria archaeon]